MSINVKESDWRTFRDSLPEWRERYLKSTIEDIADLLREGGQSPTERFWKANERIDEEAAILRDCLDGGSRSNMPVRLLLMYRHGLIEEADLERFGQELRDRILAWVEAEGE